MTEKSPRPKTFSTRFAIRCEAPQEAAFAREALAAEVAAEFGPRDEAAFALVARDGAGAPVGGVNGVIHWRWLYVAQFYVAPGWRGQGLGAALLAEAEALAREKNCVGIYLDTFSARALKFYKARGFAEAGRIDNFPPGAARSFLFKPLTPPKPGEMT
jgi:GNAT superfamily N-acetyltransferase